jgi:hypothetical protein
MALAQVPVVTGVVKYLSVFGSGPNSAEIVAVIQVAGNDEAFRVGAFPATEPSVFSSFASLLTGAYLTKTPIDVLYMPVANATPQIVGLVCH